MRLTGGNFDRHPADLPLRELVFGEGTPELAALGVPRPSSVPLYYRVASHQLTQAPLIEVVGEQSSGEVEPLVKLADLER